MTISPQMIAAAVRRQIRSSDWEWRYGAVITDGSYAGSADCRAANILRREYRRAAAWLRKVSQMTSLPLPEGNGTNGPWQRVAHVTGNGTYGLVDIAAGRAVEYDVRVPSYVARFAHSGMRAQSGNMAGGSGGAPLGWRQILVVLTSGPEPRVATPRAVRPVLITYGLSDCYGGIGAAPQPTGPEDAAWRRDWGDIAGCCPTVATLEPQRERVTNAVQPEIWSGFLRDKRWFPRAKIVLRDAYMIRNGVREQEPWLIGSRKDRADARQYIEREWPLYVMDAARMAAAKAAEAVLQANGLGSTKMSSGPGPRVSNDYHSPSAADVIARIQP